MRCGKNQWFRKASRVGGSDVKVEGWKAERPGRPEWLCGTHWEMLEPRALRPAAIGWHHRPGATMGAQETAALCAVVPMSYGVTGRGI